MKLVHVEIKNYRSVFHNYDRDRSFAVQLGDGVNAITGPNNAGKSNILRALALALDDDFEFDRQLDMPSVFPTWSKPVVTLTFQVPERGAPSPERTLLKRLREYELAVNPKLAKGGKTNADRRIVKVRVTIEIGEDAKGERRRVFVVPGVGARSLSADDPIALRALEQFERCLQFVLIRSGESLESLLQGRFREVLQTILRDELKPEFEAAEASRTEYVTALQDGVLKSLRESISGELIDLFPEVNSVTLEPDVRGLEETLVGMRVRIADDAITDLADKGTGVRGGLIVAMLQHLARTSRRSIVFAVEEPESFLHPSAQESMREDLESLTKRSDVSLLITTHSPYVISRDEAARVIAVAKDDEGRTVLAGSTPGHEPMTDALGGLFRSSLIAGYIDRSSSAVDDECAVLVVEGETDRSWLRLAAERVGRPDLLAGLTIVASSDGAPGGAGGATMAAMQAMLHRSLTTRPVAILLDNDAEGQRCLALLKEVQSKTKAWKYGERTYSYRMVLNESDHQFGYEAEDLWPDELHQQFVDKHGVDKVLAEMTARPNPLGGFHFGYKATAKPDLAEFLESVVEPHHCDLWVELLERIRTGMGLD